MAKGENPVLSTLLDINAVSLERTELDPQSLILIRLAALIAVDAPVSSYLLHLGAGAQAGLTLEQAQDVLVAVAPIAGTPRTASAAAKLAEALGLAIDIAESELRLTATRAAWGGDTAAACGLKARASDGPSQSAPLSLFARRKHSWHMRGFISFHHFRNVGWVDAH